MNFRAVSYGIPLSRVEVYPLKETKATINFLPFGL